MHTGQTDNYELTQFASSDKPAWLTDYNDDMRKIDAQMKVNADAIEEVAGNVGEEATEIEGIKDRLDTAETDIDGIQEIIGTGELQTTVKNLIGAANEILALVNQNSGDIDAVEQAIAGIGDSITGLSQLAYTIANVYDSTSTYAVGAYVIYQNTLYKCNTAITVGEAFTPAKWTSVKVMNEIPSGGGGGGTVYTAGDGIDITNDTISFDGDTAPYDNTSSGLTATNIQAAIDELVESSVVTEEVQRGTLAIGETSVTLTFTGQTIGNDTLIDVYTDAFGVNPTNVTYTASTVVLTFDAQESAVGVAVKVMN